MCPRAAPSAGGWGRATGVGGSSSALVQICGQNHESNRPSFADQKEIFEVKMMEKQQKNTSLSPAPSLRVEL